MEKLSHCFSIILSLIPTLTKRKYTFLWFICIAVSNGLNMHLMDVVTTYLYGYIYIYKSMKQLIRNIITYVQLSYKDPYMN